MSTLLRGRDEFGVVRFCDSRCYNAKSDECNCVCGGVNHGVGYRKAKENCATGAAKICPITMPKTKKTEMPKAA